ncbi:MAG: hypothetical protein KIT09_23660 [Bryobacteraceae bacterium]|nr:hypothetical protein [Bryobacteraceae bacterium]
MATIYAGLGDSGATFRWLEKTCHARDGRVQQLVWPLFDRFREEPHRPTMTGVAPAGALTAAGGPIPR